MKQNLRHQLSSHWVGSIRKSTDEPYEKLSFHTAYEAINSG